MGCFKVLSIAVGILAVLLGVVMPLGISYAFSGWTAKYTSPNPFFKSDIPDLTGKVVIVTGANVGIGFETAKEIARKGAHVIVASRSKAKGETAVEKIKIDIASDVKEPKVTFLQLDLSSLKSVKSFSESFLAMKLPLHILVNNAGIMKSPGSDFVGKELFYGFEKTSDGLEQHIGVNHIGHFYLTSLLTDKLKASAPARVVTVSSAAEMGGYKGGIRPELWENRGEEYEDGRAYAQSKLANILFANELAERLKGTGVTSYSCHPGIIATELGRYMEQEAQKGSLADKVLNAVFGPIFDFAMFKPADGALTQLQLATSPTLPVNGGYYLPIGTHAQPTNPHASDPTLPKLLWTASEKIVKKIMG